jgi:hypothetical protein
LSMPVPLILMAKLSAAFPVPRLRGPLAFTAVRPMRASNRREGNMMNAEAYET